MILSSLSAGSVSGVAALLTLRLSVCLSDRRFGFVGGARAKRAAELLSDVELSQTLLR